MDTSRAHIDPWIDPSTPTIVPLVSASPLEESNYQYKSRFFGALAKFDYPASLDASHGSTAVNWTDDKLVRLSTLPAPTKPLQSRHGWMLRPPRWGCKPASLSGAVSRAEDVDRDRFGAIGLWLRAWGLTRRSKRDEKTLSVSPKPLEWL
ncbi:hypothetical protein N7478_012442 [Penicillium angulare]|uniref:uncharacterized protein n=1 Tax=Penicillium angulare TaxID=116970 RepID=UPI00253F7A32|nr:uncharacterized protein N7478_012442 [Penicillium angulare]KAJ5259461.1 hypothetical protein N7478_012442 [Penicillium angulare]